MKRNNGSIVLAVITLVILPPPALSASGGAQLSAWCGSSQHSGSSARGDYRHLMGYVQGAADALIEHREACPPDEANIGHGVDIVCRYVAANRQLWSSTKYVLTRDALAKAFPCSKR